MYSESEKENLILSYFSVLNELYDWNFQTYDVVIHDGTYNTGVKDIHNNILKTLVLKDDSNIPSIIQELLVKELLVSQSGRYSSTGKTHWNDILEIKEELREEYKQFSGKLIYMLDLGISETLNFNFNLILMNFISSGIPLKNLNTIYPKEMSKLLTTGLTDGEKVVGFNESHFFYYKFNEHLNGEVVNSLAKNEKLTLFSNCKDYEKAVISVLAREKIIIGKGIDYYSVQEKTLDKWERLKSGIIANLNDKISECAKITKLKPTEITQIIQHLKTKGYLWEYKNFIYSVVHEVILGVLPYPSDDYIIGKIKDFNLVSVPITKVGEETPDVETEPKQDMTKELDKMLAVNIRQYIQGFCMTTRFNERPTSKKVEQYLALIKDDIAKTGWSEEEEVFKVFVNEFELIIKGLEISNSKWRKLGKVFLKGLSLLPLIPN